MNIARPVGRFHKHAMSQAEEHGFPDDIWFGSTAVNRYNEGNVITMSYPESTRLEARINGRPVRFYPTTHDLLTIMLIRGPRIFTTRNEMVDLLYAHRLDGGPLTACNRISQMLLQMAKLGVPFEVYYGWGTRIASAENR